MPSNYRDVLSKWKPSAIDLEADKPETSQSTDDSDDASTNSMSLSSSLSIDLTPAPSMLARAKEIMKSDKNNWHYFTEYYMCASPNYMFKQLSDDLATKVASVRIRSPAYESLVGRECVRGMWKELGIWDNRWDTTPPDESWEDEPFNIRWCKNSEDDFVPKPPKYALWKHEGDETAEQLFGDKKRQWLQRREASRPCAQFYFQLSLERCILRRDLQIFDKFWKGKSTKYPPVQPKPITSSDINTKTYENVKANWKKWKIWNYKWGVMPGQSWMHEMPFDEYMTLFKEIFQEPASLQPVVAGQEDDGQVQTEKDNPRPRSSKRRKTKGTKK